MKTLKYKGFIGSTSFDDKRNRFTGRILGIDSPVHFEGESVKQLTESFQKAVDDYLSFCEKEGIGPRKSYSGTLNIRISPGTHNSIADYANAAGITINAFIKRALEKAVENPAAIMNNGINPYYSIPQKESSGLSEPSIPYGTSIAAEFLIPPGEWGFAKSLGKKLGWELIDAQEKTKLEIALEDVQKGRVSKHDNLDSFFNSLTDDSDEI